MSRSPVHIDRIVGDQLRLRRIDLGMTQAELGDRLGVTFQQIQKYERGANRLSASRLYGAARALDVDLNYFFPDAPEGKDAGLREAIQEPGVLAMAMAFMKIPAGPKRVTLMELTRAMGAS